MSPTLLQRIASGERDAVQECLRSYGGLILAIARKLLPAAEVEDAVQEVFIELWRQAARFDPSRAKETTFVALVARRRCIDRLRRRSSGPDLEALGEREPADAVAPDPTRPAEVTEEVARVQELIGDLPPERQLALRLSLREGLTHREIAARTGMPLGTVKTHIRRGLIQVREQLAASGAEVSA